MRNKNIYLCIPTLNRYDLLDVCLKSAEKGTLKPNKYIIIDNGGLHNSDLFKDKKEVLNFNRNLGCAGSWNYFLNEYDGIKIICNDDLEFDEDTIEKLVNTYYDQEDNKEAGIIFPGSCAGSVFSCFILSDWCIEKVGLFDENFYPAYYEDNDYVYRSNLLKITGFHAPECGYKHLKSSTLEKYNDIQKQQHSIDFSKNRQYYISKWGGDIGHEIYTTPFNKGGGE